MSISHLLFGTFWGIVAQVCLVILVLAAAIFLYKGLCREDIENEQNIIDNNEISVPPVLVYVCPSSMYKTPQDEKYFRPLFLNEPQHNCQFNATIGQAAEKSDKVIQLA